MSEPEIEASDAAAHGRCPVCQRPIAVAGRRCIYCGTDLPEPIPEQPRPETASTLPDRLLLVVDVSGDAQAVATALGRRSEEMEARGRRRRYLLYRILPVAEARAEAARLAALRVSAIALSESAVRAASEPLIAIGGDPANGMFSLDSRSEPLRVVADDVLLVIWGPIRREPLSEETRSMRELRRAPAPRVAESDLCHVHTKLSSRPIEVDADAFAFSQAHGAIESTLLRLRRAIASLAASVEIDDGFRWEAPALGVSSSIERSSLADALSTRASRAGERKPATFLDNVAQFRFYSAWRGTLARQRTGLTDTDEPPL
jgi:hypothetical protein